MALVKSSKIGARSLKASPSPTASKSMQRAKPSPPAEKVGASTSAVLFERVAAATEEFASGLTEASAAAEQLRKSMEQIGAGAEEAAGASQEQLAAIKRISEGLRTARGETDALRRRTENVEILLGDTAARITVSARAIERVISIALEGRASMPCSQWMERVTTCSTPVSSSTRPQASASADSTIAPATTKRSAR